MPATQSSKPNGVHARVLSRARELFYRNGYYRTGVREIIKSARAATASFYDNFGSKEGLATRYLLAEEAAMRENLARLMQAHPDPESFFRVWLIAQKKDLRDQVFVGCPFAGFAYQSAAMEPEHRATLSTITRRWEDLLKAYIERAVQEKYLGPKTDARALARRVILLYQGGIAAWRMSENRDYIKSMQELILSEIYACRA